MTNIGFLLCMTTVIWCNMVMYQCDIPKLDVIENYCNHLTTDQPAFVSEIGKDFINIDNGYLKRYKLPAEYYPHLDHSSFQPYMSYKAVTNKKSEAYRIINHQNAYSDDFGFRRLKLDTDVFSLESEDDYIIALGNYYKQKGQVGDRFLIVTANGMYTATVGDEKSDNHTDRLNMFSRHGKNKVGVIEWIVDTTMIDVSIKKHGTITAGPIEVLKGELLFIYKITT